jgi:2-dehydro-3-deoxyphosphogluconate aldolase/(4S)-4-hydroxy-2-oxoglutarate aldolase
MSEVLRQIESFRVMPIVSGLTADAAGPLADALIAGGLPLLEVTLRSESSLPALRSLKDRRDLLLGAGTILSIDQAKSAIDAGARFLVAPGLDLKLVDWAMQNNVPIFPGVQTATELTHAYNAGLRVVKFFPAEPAGGINTIKMLAGPFPGMRFLPTGGITPELIGNYLESPLIVAAGQSAMVRPEFIAGGRWTEVTETTRRVLAIAASVSPVR